MSTSYRLNVSVSVEEFLAAVEKTGLKVHTPSNKEDISEDKICITCGENYLWFYVNSDKSISDSCRYGGNYAAQETIQDVLSEELGVGYLSEHDEGYFDEDPMGDGDEPKVWP
jgi:hypothetical protein